MGKKVLYTFDPEDFFNKGSNKSGGSSASEFERAFALAVRIQKMQEKKEKKKKEEESKNKKPEEAKKKMLTTIHWMMILIGSFPFTAPLYLYYVNTLLSSIK